MVEAVCVVLCLRVCGVFIDVYNACLFSGGNYVMVEEVCVVLCVPTCRVFIGA
jgi:hypothetical protein